MFIAITEWLSVGVQWLVGVHSWDGCDSLSYGFLLGLGPVSVSLDVGHLRRAWWK